MQNFVLADLLYLLVAVTAALAARALMLFGLFPLLSLARVVQKVSTPMKTVIIWGGLRGSVTLALALSVTENAAIEPEVQRFIAIRSEEHTSELQSLMRLSYAVFCLKKKKPK